MHTPKRKIKTPAVVVNAIVDDESPPPSLSSPDGKKRKEMNEKSERALDESFSFSIRGATRCVRARVYSQSPPTRCVNLSPVPAQKKLSRGSERGHLSQARQVRLFVTAIQNVREPVKPMKFVD